MPDSTPLPVSDQLLDELVAGNRTWGAPNDRTGFVDAALVRVCRAMDSAAAALESPTKRKVFRTIDVSTSAASLLTFRIDRAGHWSFDSALWTDSGRTQSATLLRPTLRGIARATRPDHARVLAELVADVDLICAQIIAEAGVVGRSAARSVEASVDELFAARFSIAADSLHAIRKLGDPLDVAAGVSFITAGTKGRELFFILDGVVEVLIAGAKRPIRLGGGSVVGEQSVLLGETRSATVRCVSDTLLFVVPDHGVDDLPADVKSMLGRKVQA